MCRWMLWHYQELTLQHGSNSSLTFVQAAGPGLGRCSRGDTIWEGRGTFQHSWSWLFGYCSMLPFCMLYPIRLEACVEGSSIERNGARRHGLWIPVCRVADFSSYSCKSGGPGQQMQSHRGHLCHAQLQSALAAVWCTQEAMNGHGTRAARSNRDILTSRRHGGGGGWRRGRGEGAGRPPGELRGGLRVGG